LRSVASAYLSSDYRVHFRAFVRLLRGFRPGSNSSTICSFRRDATLARNRLRIPDGVRSAIRRCQRSDGDTRRKTAEHIFG
jgi:hypothetical protein